MSDNTDIRMANPICDYFRFRPWTLQLTSIVVLTNALAIISGDLITRLMHHLLLRFNCFGMSYVVCFQYLLNQRIFFSMVGHGLHSAVFGFTFGAYVCSIVPVIKVHLHNIILYR